MLAHHPFKYEETEQDMTREEFVLFLLSLPGLVARENAELLRFEVSWNKDKMTLKTLYKYAEAPETTSKEQCELGGHSLPVG
jgi:hypothetical protein